MNARTPLAVLAIVALGCATTRADNNAAPQPIPERYQEAVLRAERLGVLIYKQDRAAWVATDAIFSAFPDSRSTVRGWVTTPLESGWLVFFFAKGGDEISYAYRVELDSDFKVISVVDQISPPDVSSDHLAQYRARQRAIEHTALLCSTQYNTVVLPGSAIGESGWLVYLLPASTIPGEQYLGHHRVLVTPDGGTIVRNEPLSNTCLRTPPPPPNAVGAYVTHLISSTPIEIHVFRNLSTGRPLYVAADANMWSIEGGVISFHGPLDR